MTVKQALSLCAVLLLPSCTAMQQSVCGPALPPIATAAPPATDAPPPGFSPPSAATLPQAGPTPPVVAAPPPPIVASPARAPNPLDNVAAVGGR